MSSELKSKSLEEREFVTLRKNFKEKKKEFSKVLGVDETTSDNFSVSSAHNSDEHYEYDDTVSPPLNKFTQDSELRITPNKSLKQFIWTTSPQPHAVRRRFILQKYPEIEKLYGNNPKQAVTALCTILCQFYLCYAMSYMHIPIWCFILITFFASGTLNHSLFAAMHEGSHRTIYQSKLASEFFCIATTLPMGLPAAIPFKRYHLDHHIYQGVTDLDPDVPTEIEGWFFRSKFRKFLWVFILPATYSLRPLITRPKNIVIMDVVNWCLCLFTDISIYYFWGVKSLLYFLLGTFFSMNFHPFAGHFISEHFILPETDMYQETSSYYGLMNLLTYNVGYHNEHHDFPRVPGSHLPLVRQIASEYYDIPMHNSWMNVTWKFIFCSTVTPFNRVKRMGVRGGNLPAKYEPFKYHKEVLPFGAEHHFWPNIKKNL